MDPVTFTLYTALGSAVWNVALIGAGYTLGDNWKQVGEWISTFQYVIIAAIAAAAGWWIWTRFISAKHKARRAAEEAELATQEKAAEMILRATDDL
jgi:membrane protein DedA with SNARE-associated domain